MARWSRLVAATSVSGASSDGFQITGSPHTSASAVFHDQTTVGKLTVGDALMRAVLVVVPLEPAKRVQQVDAG
jgi:hypothetical protein